jgi:circadian clock protein KaiB
MSALDDSGEKWKLRLYVVHSALESQAAILNIKQLLGKYLPGHYELEIIDLFESPLTAMSDRVTETPTLIKIHPAPACRITGDLGDEEQVLDCLGLVVD